MKRRDRNRRRTKNVVKTASGMELIAGVSDAFLDEFNGLYALAGRMHVKALRSIVETRIAKEGPDARFDLESTFAEGLREMLGNLVAWMISYDGLHAIMSAREKLRQSVMPEEKSPEAERASGLN